MDTNYVRQYTPLKWDAPSPELITPNTSYSFSFSPKEQPMLESINRVDPFGTNLKEYITERYGLFNRLKNCTLKLNLELSRNGRFHFHGTIKITNILLFYSVDIRRLQAHGTYEIDIISDPMFWDLYCAKQADLMKDFAESEGIEYIYRSQK